MEMLDKPLIPAGEISAGGKFRTQYSIDLIIFRSEVMRTDKKLY